MSAEKTPLLSDQPPAWSPPTDGRFVEWEIDKPEVFKQENNKMFWFNVCLGGPCLFIGLPLPILMAPFHYACSKPILQKTIYSQRLTTDDANLVFQQGPTWSSSWLCRLPQCYRGRVTKTIPFDRIQDIIVSDAGGNYCCCYPVKVSTVDVQTAGAVNPKGDPELRVQGVKNAYQLRDYCLSRTGAGSGGLGGGPVVTHQPGAQGYQQVQGTRSLESRLREAKSVFEEGLMTEKEFQAHRQRILDEI